SFAPAMALSGASTICPPDPESATITAITPMTTAPITPPIASLVVLAPEPGAALSAGGGGCSSAPSPSVSVDGASNTRHGVADCSTEPSNRQVAGGGSYSAGGSSSVFDGGRRATRRAGNRTPPPSGHFVGGGVARTLPTAAYLRLISALLPGHPTGAVPPTVPG